MRCPICKLQPEDVTITAIDDRFDIKCPRCGNFKISGTANAILNTKEANFKLSSWIRNQFESGSEPPNITSTSLNDIPNSIPKYTVSEKQLILLRALERKTEYAGKPVNIITHFDFPIAFCRNTKEFSFLIQSIIDRGLIQSTDNPSESFSLRLTITPNGWTHLEETTKPSIFKNQVFVAMSFSKDLRSAWSNGIKPALVKAGYSPYRTDAEPHIDRIDAKIISEIKNSKFVIADVTEQRPGVYFEAGFAIGLGLPVFWCVREDDLNNIHFDTRQYNHIVWNNEEILAEQLFYNVIALIGAGTAS